MKRINTNPSQLWDQWLQRLHGIEDPQKKYFRLELIQLLVRSEKDDKKTFLHRFGTVMCRSIHFGTVLLVDKKNQKILYSNENIYGGKNTKKILERIPRNKGLSIKQFPRGRKIIENRPLSKGIYQIPITIFPEDNIVLVIISLENLPVEDRQFLQFVSSLIGVFEQKTIISRELAQEQRLLGLLTQHINQGLVLFSPDLTATLWNRPLQRITGYSPKEAHGKPFDELIKIKNQSNWLSKLIKKYNLNKQQNSFSLEGEITTKTKSSRWISISGSFLRDENGNIEQTIALIRDISKTKELEERKNEFISIATHELRTPITVIKGYLSLLKSNQNNLSEKQQTYLDNAYSATERLVGLTEDLLQVTRLDQNRMKFNLRLVELTSIIKKVSDDFSEKARDKGLEFNISLPSYKTTIVGDPIRLEQVFSNLVDNAIKYSIKGSVSISFEHYTKRTTKEDKIAVIIKDTGIGIDHKDIEGIFDKFHRTEKAGDLRVVGVGLGLYIVKSFIEKQNGSITVKSRLKRGSVFAVTFPVISDLSKMPKIVPPKKLETATDKKADAITRGGVAAIAEEKIGSSMGRVK